MEISDMTEGLKIMGQTTVITLLILYVVATSGTGKVEAQQSGDYASSNSSSLTSPSAPFLELYNGEYVELPQNDSLKLSDFIISVWFNSNHTGPGDAYIVSRGALGAGEKVGENMNYAIYISAGSRLRGGFESSNGTDYIVSPQTNYADGKWHNVLLSYNGSILNMYVDGSLETSLDTGAALPDTKGNYPLRIGASSANSERGLFTGLIDGLLILNSTTNFPVNITTGMLESTISNSNKLVDIEVTEQNYPQIANPKRSPFVFLPGLG